MTHAAPSARRHETPSLQDRIDRAACGPLAIRLAAQQRPEDLLAAPSWIRLAHTQHRAFDIRRRLVGMRVWRAWQVAQAFRTERVLPMQDLVASLAADPELAARIDHRQVASLHRDFELHPLVARVGLGPRHPWNGPAATRVVTCECYPCARTRVSPMYPGRTGPCPPTLTAPRSRAGWSRPRSR